MFPSVCDLSEVEMERLTKNISQLLIRRGLGLPLTTTLRINHEQGISSLGNLYCVCRILLQIVKQEDSQDYVNK